MTRTTTLRRLTRGEFFGGRKGNCRFLQGIFSSSKGNSEEETNGDNFVDCTVSPTPPHAKNDEHSLNGLNSIDNTTPPEPNE